MTGFFQVKHADDSIEQSMGRLIAFMAAVTGILVLAYGGVFKDVGVMAIGAGLFGSGELLKFGQKVGEK